MQCGKCQDYDTANHLQTCIGFKEVLGISYKNTGYKTKLSHVKKAC